MKGMAEKLKIVWICHFSNQEIQEYLPLWKNSNEFASWIPNMIVGFEKRNDVELHIVAPHIYLKRNTSFFLRGIYYHFISFGLPIINRPWPSFFALDAVIGYPLLSQKITRTVMEINPDIVNLQGAENAYYSSSILLLKQKFPCVITIQGFAFHMQDQYKRYQINRRRIKTEKKILCNFKYFYLDNDAINVVKEYSPEMIGKVIWWPAAETIIDKLPEISYEEKKYDILFCARIERSKGVEDFIMIVSYLKKNNPHIKACIIGPYLPKYYKYLKELAVNLNCLSNITFTGFIDSQKEMFSYFKESKIFLVPTLVDRYPSTIREAMRLRIPVVAYRTGDIPWTNKNGENIILINSGNVGEMAEEVNSLLKDRIRQERIIEAARNFYEQEFSCQKNVARFIDGYNNILKKDETIY